MPSHDLHVSVDPLGASKDMHGSGSKVHWSYFFFFLVFPLTLGPWPSQAPSDQQALLVPFTLSLKLYLTLKCGHD